MDPTDDDDWLDALAGRARPGSRSATLVEAALLRRAAQAWPPAVAAEPAPQDDAALQQAAARAGLLRRRWCGACAARWEAWQQRVAAASPRAWALAASLAMALMLSPLAWRDAAPPEPVTRGAAGDRSDSKRLLQHPDPRAERDRLAADLEALGARVQRFERLGRHGLSAEWPGPLPPAGEARLRELGLARAADGSVEVEIEALP
jgi:hypothetical protein